MFISVFGKICFEHFQKVNVFFLPHVDWGFKGRKQNRLRVLTFDFVIGAVAIGQFREERQCKNKVWRSQIGVDNCILLKTPKNDYRFVVISSESKRKKIKASSPPSENRRRVFKQPSSELAVTSKLHEDHQKVFEN